MLVLESINSLSGGGGAAAERAEGGGAERAGRPDVRDQRAGRIDRGALQDVFDGRG